MLVAGATGFVGQCVARRLHEEGYEVVGTSRRPEAAKRAVPGYEWRRLDAETEATFAEALSQCDAAVYLIHAMGSGHQYEAAERSAAERFAQHAHRAGVQRIVYLGGVEPSGPASRHLRSRLETGRVLRAGPVTTVELRAAMIIGPGSESWRIVRDLSARLPFMLLPKWLESESEPIAVADVEVAISHCLKMPLSESAIYSLPGPQRLSAKSILRRCAQLQGMDPYLLPVPVVTPRLSSYWIRLVTRANKHIAEELVEGLRSDLTTQGEGLWALLPEHRRLAFDAAAIAALQAEEQSLKPRVRLLERLMRRVMGRRFREPVPRAT